MPGRAADLIEIPDSLWQRAAMIEALRHRDIGRVFHLLRQYAGASQTRLAIACNMTQPKVSGIMRGTAKVETLEVFERIADGLNMPGPARAVLGLAPKPAPATASPDPSWQPQRRGTAIPPRDACPALHASPVSDLLNADPANGEEDEDPVRRRTFVGLAATSLFGVILSDTARDGLSGCIESFAAALTAYSPGTTDAALGAPSDIPALAVAVARAKRNYQACRYSAATGELPALLPLLQEACAAPDGEAGLQAHRLSAEAHHVATSILLKAGDHGLACLAADRSMQAARASQDPVTIGSSARIVTHAMSSSGHLKAATSTASSYAANLDRDVPTHDAESLSVYGALLLRGAIAAAQHDDRHTAHELLAEAGDAAKRLGEDRNLRWTAFGPTNAKLHRVNVAVTLGDAGTAIDVARTVNLSNVTVTERRASFLVDTARAFLQCGKSDKAYLTLRAAEEMAHEDIAGRPAVHRLVRDLITLTPPSARSQVEDSAQQIGIAR
jgi:transcriptional regulator with XRE-family HTH domain